MDPKKFLFYAWLTFSTISTVLSLSSLADNILSWSPFFQEIIESYRRITGFFWNNIFSIFGYKVSQQLQDYLTINSLFSVSVVWGFFNISKELGFPYSSVINFIKSNFFTFQLEGNFFELFTKRAKKKLIEVIGYVPATSIAAIKFITRGYSKIYLIFNGIFSSIILIILFYLFHL